MTKLKLVEAAEAFTIVAVGGRLDPAGVGAIESKLTRHTVGRGKPSVIDLSEVEFIGSIGIGMLIGIGKAMRGQGLGVAVVAAATIKEILDMLTIGSLFPVVASRDEALRALGVK